MMTFEPPVALFRRFSTALPSRSPQARPARPEASPPERLEDRRWPLNEKQRSFAGWMRPLWTACDLAARALGRPTLSAQENTRRCYESFFDPLCADTGVWPDYTEGYFERGDESYDEAKIKQFDLILDRTSAGPGTRVLDLGCGNGKLLERARARGCTVTGVTLSRKQAETCRAAGIAVEVCSFDELPARFPAGSFDVVVFNGSSEHMIDEEDVRAGREEEGRRKVFGVLRHLLASGGRVFFACIHFRWPTAIEEAMKHPLEHPVGSYYFQISVLLGIYSGWYPMAGAYERFAAENGLDLFYEEDATRHYLATSRLWVRRLRAFVERDPAFLRRFFARLWLEDPRYFFYVALYWMYDPWTWQFRGGEESPMIHRWLGFVRRDDA